MCKFFLPFGYAFETRAKTKVHRISFLLLIAFPIYFTVCLLNKEIYNVFTFFIALSSLYSVYEIGYIYNDVLTVQYEAKPTKWLNDAKANWIKQNYEIVIAIKVFWIIGCVYYIGVINKELNTLYFSFAAAGMNFTYALHNRLRGRANCVTDTVLQFFKYCTLVIALDKMGNAQIYAACLFLEIGLLRGYEYSVEHGYINSRFKISVDQKRIYYYAILTLIGAAVCLFAGESVLLIESLYFLTYRILCYIMQKNPIIDKERRQNCEK